MSYLEQLSVNEVFDLYRQWRENNERRSEDIIYTYLLQSINENSLKKLGSEKYVILEQIIYAALDCHYYAIAKMWTSKLNDEFPNSFRVLRYRVMCLEAEGNVICLILDISNIHCYADDRTGAALYSGLEGPYQENVDECQKKRNVEALEEYDKIIKVDDTQAPARKRCVAIYKAMGLIPEAIVELVDYLKKFMSDVEAWQELCELYLQVQEYSKAAFCAEEQILHSPHHHLLHQRLADIRYTMGGLENMELAKTYYCQALKLNPDNMRALLGLFLASSQLAGQPRAGGGGARRQEAGRLAAWARRRLAARPHGAVLARALKD